MKVTTCRNGKEHNKHYLFGKSVNRHHEGTQRLVAAQRCLSFKLYALQMMGALQYHKLELKYLKYDKGYEQGPVITQDCYIGIKIFKFTDVCGIRCP